MNRLEQLNKQKLEIDLAILKEKLKNKSWELADTKTQLQQMTQEVANTENTWRDRNTQLYNDNKIYVEKLDKFTKRFQTLVQVSTLDVLFDSQDDRDYFWKARNAGNHIQCIKMLREWTDLGLKEAKDFYEKRFRDWVKHPDRGVPPYCPPTAPAQVVSFPKL